MDTQRNYPWLACCLWSIPFDDDGGGDDDDDDDDHHNDHGDDDERDDANLNTNEIWQKPILKQNGHSCMAKQNDM